MSSPAQRAANAAHHQRLREAGVDRKSFWLTPEAQAIIERHKAEHGSANAVIEAALRKLDQQR